MFSENSAISSSKTNVCVRDITSTRATLDVIRREIGRRGVLDACLHSGSKYHYKSLHKSYIRKVNSIFLVLKHRKQEGQKFSHRQKFSQRQSAHTFYGERPSVRVPLAVEFLLSSVDPCLVFITFSTFVGIRWIYSIRIILLSEGRKVAVIQAQVFGFVLGTYVECTTSLN